MNTKNIISITGAILILLTSCDDYLEPVKDNRLFEDQVFTNPQYAEGLLLNAYDDLPTSYSFTDVATDNAVTNEKGSNLLRMATGEWKASFTPVAEWGSAYRNIYYLNLFLSNLEEVEWSWEREEVNALFLKRLKGEAQGLRAWYEFQLLQAHAGLSEDDILLGFPIITERLDAEDNLQLPRDTYEDCVTQILSDCDAAITNLSAEYVDTGDPIYDAVYGESWDNRFTSRAARALKSRVLLHAASPAFTLNSTENEKQQRWEDAATSAGEMLSEAGGLAAISPNGDQFYLPQSEDPLVNPDVIWRANLDEGRTIESQNYPPSLFGQGRVNPSQNLVDAFPMLNGYPIDHSSSGYNPSDPYVNRDPRFEKYIVYNFSKLRGASIFTATGLNSDDVINQVPTSTRTGYYLKKLLNTAVNLDPNVNSVAVHIFAYFRFTEIFLNYAEAANEAWGPDADPNGYGFTARDVITAIRSRAGIEQPDNYLAELTTKEQFRGLIQNERRLELCFEGFRFWDLRRWNSSLTEACQGAFVAFNGGGFTYDYKEVEQRSYQPYMVYGPIPYNETLIYDIRQNKGW